MKASELRGKDIAASGTLARTARYDQASAALSVVLANGCVVMIPVALVEMLADAPDQIRAEVEVIGIGTRLHWPSLDLDLSVAGLLAGVLGTTKWIDCQRASRAGAAQSEAKSAAARANGTKGGRPRKVPPAISA